MAGNGSIAPPGGSRFYAHPARVLSEYLTAWRLAVRTLPDDQLAREYGELCEQSRDREPVPANMLVEVYGAEIDRRRVG
jgi:hypothetical protein